jgi:hypothetical protein
MVGIVPSPSGPLSNPSPPTRATKAGFTPEEIHAETKCHCCATEFPTGAILFRPVFERGVSPEALDRLPEGKWLDCSQCAAGHL